MDKNLINISKIETFFNSLLDNKLSDNTFFTFLPPTIKSDWTELVLVDIPNAVRDLNAYGSGMVLIYLYAKPLSNGVKPVAKLSQMEKTLNDLVALSNDGHYIVSRANSYADYDEQRNMFCNIVEINLVVI